MEKEPVLHFNEPRWLDSMDQEQFKDIAKDKRLTLHCFGDSYTAGHGIVPYKTGLNNGRLIWDFFNGKHKEESFPYYILKLSNCFRPDGISIIARGGAGNIEILQAIIKRLPNIAPNDQVIIGATNADRFLFPARPKRAINEGYNSLWDRVHFTDDFQWMSGDNLPAIETPMSALADVFQDVLDNRTLDGDGNPIVDEVEGQYIDNVERIVDWANLVTKDKESGSSIHRAFTIVEEHLLRTVAKYIALSITPNVILWGHKMWENYQTITEWTKDSESPIEDMHWSPYGHQSFANTIMPFILHGYHEIGLER